MSYFLDWREHEDFRAEKFYKTTLWQGEHVMVGLNCLEPDQEQLVHAHPDADKFYFVLCGSGIFYVGDESGVAQQGTVVMAPAGIPHGVKNQSTDRLTMLVVIAPGIK
ncbi:MAG: cupin domain-containing protein [Pyrinomonadaceae bacterium]